MKKEFKFTAVNSGDGESFCFEVDRETFRKVMKRDPEDFMDYVKGEFIDAEDGTTFKPENENALRIYPDSLFGGFKEKVKIKITVESI